ncbi:MAG: hypothetical protein P8Q15_03255, partial [Methylophilaceae bacterium]|nr:hypothetical protein [Methylophilaceae bacterium]
EYVWDKLTEPLFAQQVIAMLDAGVIGGEKSESQGPTSGRVRAIIQPKKKAVTNPTQPKAPE